MILKSLTFRNTAKIFYKKGGTKRSKINYFMTFIKKLKSLLTKVSFLAFI